MFEKIDELLKQLDCERTVIFNLNGNNNENIYVFENFKVTVQMKFPQPDIVIEMNKRWDLLDDFYQTILEVKKQTTTKINYDFVYNLFMALHAKGYVRFKS